MDATRSTPSSFSPKILGETIRHGRDTEQKHEPFVTLLIGAGFSKSAGIPLANEIVEQLRA
ncbi:MAG: hypothetical protein LW860_20755, partial [Xanthomonadaceae bacterium]|nr:hypothetical protein [Xanthomonadaceae bacterium]